LTLVALCVVGTASATIAGCQLSDGTAKPGCAAGACTDSTINSCCRPDDAGAQYCAEIKPSDLNGTNAVCLWANTYGQTPDTNEAFNAPWVNNLACGNANGRCNFNSQAAINDNTYSQSSADTSGTTADYAVSANTYYGVVSNISDADRAAPATTAQGYWTAFNQALSRYNCEEQYSHWNCDDCRKAYARWACAITYPQCDPTTCTTIKPWEYVCYQVVQKCPVTLGFTCPLVENDDRDYTSSGGNYMGLVNGAETTSVSTAISVVVTTMVLAMQW